MKILRRIGFVLLAVLFGIIAFAALLSSALLIADAAVDASARILPSYAREDITPVLAKETWTDEDFETLYLQTGLGRSALEALQGEDERILAFQDALFYEGAITHEEVAITTKRDIFADRSYRAPIAPLEKGDVLLTSTCHSFGWRNGHAALVIEPKTGTLLESVSLGTPSILTTFGDNWFRYGTNFMVLRLKDATAEERAAIADTARERLYNIPYSLFVGFFSPKDQGETPQETHCSHLVWQAFHYYGYDVDSNGGPLCAPQDIARSDLFEVVQVFGFDPLKLW